MIKQFARGGSLLRFEGLGMTTFKPLNEDTESAR